MNITFDVMTFA